MHEGFDIDDDFRAAQTTALLTKPAWLPLATVLDEEENVLEMTGAVALIDFSEEAKRLLEVFGEALNSV